MKISFRLLLSLCLLLPLLGNTRNVPENKARTLALNFYFERASIQAAVERSAIKISGSYLVKDQGIDLFYVFNINGDKGFVLVSATDQVIPVLGYSFEGNYKQDNQPEAVQSWINGYKQQIASAISLNLPADEATSTQWKKYTQDGFTAEKSMLSVNPLLTTNWDQGCYYNSLCPAAAGGDCNHVWVGCVATAMAQVMKYHNYPDQGVGSHTYNHATYGPQSADFGSTTYNWSAMPNQVSSPNTATATLMYHCGVSVNMNYGVSGSGAYTQDVRTALVNYFSYASTTQYVQRLWYSSSGWENLLVSELDSHQPVVYSGQDPNFGHCFVCDGYQGTNYFHFNWGWSGWNNGYFYVSNLNSGNGNFTTNQAAVVHIAPAPVGPQPSFSVTATQFCAETTVQFQDNTSGTPTSWNWQFPGGNPTTSTLEDPSVTYSSPGNYDVILTVTDGLNTNTITKNNYIKVKTKPYGLFPSDTSICCNNTITLDAGNPGSTYTWSTGLTTQTHLIDSTGVGIGQRLIKVEILTAEGCWNMDSILITFAPCTGISDIQADKFVLYPNPANGTVTISNAGTMGIPATLKLYNAGGELMKMILYTGNRTEWQLNISDLRSGMYLLIIEQENNKTYRKLLVN